MSSRPHLSQSTFGTARVRHREPYINLNLQGCPLALNRSLLETQSVSILQQSRVHVVLPQIALRARSAEVFRSTFDALAAGRQSHQKSNSRLNTASTFGAVRRTGGGSTPNRCAASTSALYLRSPQ